MKLVDLLTSIHAADSSSEWSTLKQRRKKRAAAKQSDATHPDMSARQALIKLVYDRDHIVRMHVARAVTTLFFAPAKGGVPYTAGTNQMSRTRSCDNAALLSSALQKETFQQIMEVLQLAFVIPNDLDELSSEDESVNRFASRIYTLLMCGCVSPVCERKVIGELVMAVGRGVDTDLVAKVNGREGTSHYKSDFQGNM